MYRASGKLFMLLLVMFFCFFLKGFANSHSQQMFSIPPPDFYFEYTEIQPLDFREVRGVIPYGAEPFTLTANCRIYSSTTGLINAMLTSYGNLFTWGSRHLGHGYEDLNAPVLLLQNIRDVSIGWHHSLAIDTSGAVWAWGSNMDGVIYPSYGSRNFFRPIKIAENAAAIYASRNLSLISFDNGELWKNGSMLLRDDERILSPGGSPYVYRSVTAMIMQSTDIVDVRTSGHAVLILKNDNTLWGVGEYIPNFFAYCSEDMFLSSDEPIYLLSNVISIEVESRSTFVRRMPRFVRLAFILEDDSLWMWGDFGYFGRGEATEIIPSPIHIMDNVKSVKLNNQSTTVLLNTGELIFMGITGGREQALYPTKIADGILQFSLSGRLIARDDGNLWEMQARQWNYTSYFKPVEYLFNYVDRTGIELRVAEIMETYLVYRGIWGTVIRPHESDLNTITPIIRISDIGTYVSQWLSLYVNMDECWLGLDNPVWNTDVPNEYRLGFTPSLSIPTHSEDFFNIRSFNTYVMDGQLVYGFYLYLPRRSGREANIQNRVLYNFVNSPNMYLSLTNDGTKRQMLIPTYDRQRITELINLLYELQQYPIIAEYLTLKSRN